MKRRHHYIEDEEGDMLNLTPLLDVLFVVLVLFMLAAPLLQLDKITLAKSSLEKEEFAPSEPSILKIQVNEKGDIEIQNKQIHEKLLQPTFLALYEKFPNMTPTLFCDKNAPFGTYQEIKNNLEAAGYREMEVILKSH